MAAANVAVGSAADTEHVVQERFEAFIMGYYEQQPATDDSSQPVRVFIYKDDLEDIRARDTNTLHVNYQHVFRYDEELAEAILEEYYRFELELRRAVQNMMQKIDASAVRSKNNTLKEYFVSFYEVPTTLRVRELKSNVIGQLVSITGTVTRTSEVRPELLYGTFKCAECGTLERYLEQQFKYVEPGACANAECGNKNKWELLPDKSVFVDWQRLRLQENSDEIPPGSMPRTVDVILRHSCVERAKAGDKVTLVGSVIVVPDVSQMFKQRDAPKVHRQASGAQGSGITGLKSLGVREMTYRLAFLCSSVTTEGSKGKDPTLDEDVIEPTQLRIKRVLETMTKQQVDKINEMNKDEAVFAKLTRSVALTVHGHAEIKRGLLLMLFGGVQKRTPEGIRLRGDLNVCVVGDPSTAKSQFLKWTCQFLPRAVYTSGKASSSAGLTASVIKDPDTGEFCVEAGALMLADNSVCCIDEFDKMDPGDQVAIHEAMEQQTISITKAGIQATLNARTSILAAANPVFGRYDKTKTLRQNVNISPPILSRFDLFFVVVDDMNEQTDHMVANHIVNVHRKLNEALIAPYTTEDVQNYIRVARQIDPVMTPEAEKAIVSCYVRLRSADAVGSTQQSYRITVRQLESLVRLSEAMARAHLTEFVTAVHVQQAFNLLKRSILTVDTPDVDLSTDMNPIDELDVDVDMAGGDSGSDRASERDSDAGSRAGSKAGSQASSRASTSLKISGAAFQSIKTQLLLHLREEESKYEMEAGADVAEMPFEGLQQRVLVEWFLEESVVPRLSGDDIEAEVERQRDRVRGVIERLVRDGVLVIADPAPVDDASERHLIVHPNVIVQ